ncbi:MAG: hypothetical protein J6V44_13360 [Methanobrevibacter sp.]|nr:hypothetical protein [Methanobrevibacter sp.]
MMRNNKKREWFYIVTIVVLMLSIIAIKLCEKANATIGDVFLTISSILLVFITIRNNIINRKRDSFSQLFNTQISLFNHYFNNNTILRTNTISKDGLIPLVVSEKSFQLKSSVPITKNFCEYYKANIKETGYRELSSSEIIKIWDTFCESLQYRSEFEYSFKSIFMCIRTVQKENYLGNLEKKEYLTTINDLLNSEQLFCYFVNQVHFCDGDLSKDKNIKLLKDNEFFSDLTRSAFYKDIKHSIPKDLKKYLLWS